MGQVSCPPPRQKQLEEGFGGECCSVPMVSGEGKISCVDFLGDSKGS